jgi:hypothetical protein
MSTNLEASRPVMGLLYLTTWSQCGHFGGQKRSLAVPRIQTQVRIYPGYILVTIPTMLNSRLRNYGHHYIIFTIPPLIAFSKVEIYPHHHVVKHPESVRIAVL